MLAAAGALRQGLVLIRAACADAQANAGALACSGWQGEAADSYRQQLRSICAVASDSDAEAIRCLALVDGSTGHDDSAEPDGTIGSGNAFFAARGR